MTSRTPKARRGETVRRAVLAATAEAIDTDGVAGARIADIAARAGVHETSVYRRWGTRSNLLLEAVMDRLDTALPLPDTGSTREDLTSFFTALATFLTTPAGESLVHAATAGDRFDGMRREFWAARLARATVLVDRGVDRGDLAEDTDAELVLEMLAGPIQLRVLLRGEEVDRGYVTRLVDLTLRAWR
ncbi:TetR-like C-terminal domain-containing protein [Amycolatopsis sp. CA-230715]|uniref:TetR-like C-terminal domain-containing protein n=1 Tax=Amycolatopsis sp. CA-230715 TaxID=2745196 RepID=UPI001C02669D|nr:TetR-like C-terminal domain-containing protein [Amycolatopsis sp. CA-230715]